MEELNRQVKNISTGLEHTEQSLNKLYTEVHAQGATISDLQIKLSNQADLISELRSELYHLQHS